MVKVGIIGAGRIGRVHITRHYNKSPQRSDQDSGGSLSDRRNCRLGKEYGSRKNYKRLQGDH